MNLLQIAKVLKPQGIKGEIKVELFTSDLKFLKSLKLFKIDDKDYSIKSIRFQQKYAYIATNEIQTRNDAELLRNKILCAPKPQNETDKEDEYYISDLENCTVVDENDNIIGYVESVEKYTSTPIINILLGGAVRSFPFIKAVLKHVNVSEKKIVVYKDKLQEVIV